MMAFAKSFLTMCAYCKDVRDPLGRWRYVNQGLLEWLEYRLSHGICPGCVAEHFPEFAASIKAGEKSAALHPLDADPA